MALPIPAGEDTGSGGSTPAPRRLPPVVVADNFIELRLIDSRTAEMVIVRGRDAQSDGGEGSFQWVSTLVALDDDDAIRVVPTAAPVDGGWMRLSSDFAHSAGWHGASPDADEDTNLAALQAWLDGCIADGAEGWLPAPGGLAIYQCGGTLTIGGAGNPVAGPVLRASKRTLSAAGAMIQYTGAPGGVLLDIRNADAGTIQNIGFHGGSVADNCVRLRHYLGDLKSIRGWRFEGCYFGSSVEDDVFFEGTGADYYGDANGSVLASCYFGVPQGGAQPTSHLRLSQPNTVGLTILNPVFDALADDDAGGPHAGWPSYAIWIEAGSVYAIGLSVDPIGIAAIRLTGINGVQLGSFEVYGAEVQSGKKLLVTETVGSGAGASLRPCILSGCLGDDIIAPTETTMITWDVGLYGTLILQGAIEGNVDITNPQSSVVCAGATILGNYGFLTHPEVVQGYWLQNGARCQQGIGVKNYNADPTTPFQLSVEAADTIYATITLSTVARMVATCWLSDVAGKAPAAAAPDGGFTTNDATLLLQARVANKVVDALADANGQIVLKMIHGAGAASWYLNVEVPGCPLVSMLVTFAA